MTRRGGILLLFEWKFLSLKCANRRRKSVKLTQIKFFILKRFMKRKAFSTKFKCNKIDFVLHKRNIYRGNVIKKINFYKIF